MVVMITMSLWGLLLMEGIYDGMTEQMIDNSIRSSSGHITIHARGYRRDNDLSKVIKNPQSILSFLQENQLVKAHTMKLNQNGLIATAHQSRNAQITGVSLETERHHGRLQDYLVSGQFSFGKQDRGAIIGHRLAQKLKTKTGKKIVLSAQDANNEVASQAFKITGILKTNNVALDEIAVFISQKQAKSMLAVTSGATHISLMLHNEEDTHQLQVQLQKRFPMLDIYRWDEIYPALLQGRVMMEGFNLVISLLIFCIAGLGIFAVILVSVLERIREFGILLAIGTSFNQIRAMVLGESFFLGFSGFITGSILGSLSLIYLKKYGLDLTMFGEGLEAFGVDTIVYAIIKPSYYTTSFCSVFIATLLSVLLPLRILKKAQPIQAINKH